MTSHANIHTNARLLTDSLWSSFNHATSMIHEWWARQAMRKTLGKATDKQLQDAGLIRQDIEDACGLPLSSAAEAAIRAAARMRGASW